MRIISGNLKGKKILSPKNELTRPLKDLTKESIFNLIKHSKLLDCKLENANVLIYLLVWAHLVSSVYLEELNQLLFLRIIKKH